MDLQHRWSHLAAIGLASLAGLSLAATAPPAGLPATALPSILALFWSLHLAGPQAKPGFHRDIVWPLLAYFLIGWGISYGWVLDHIWTRTALISVLLLAFLALVGAIVCRTGYRLAGAYGLAASAMALEAALTFGPVSMPLVSTGFTVSGTSWETVVPLFGITGVSFLLWGLAAMVFGLAPRTQPIVILLWMLISVSGCEERQLSVPDAPSPVLPVALIQPGIPAASWANVRDDSRIHDLASRSDSSRRLLIWPETALPVGTAQRQDSLLQRHAPSDVIAGGIMVSDGGDVHNAAVYWQAPHPPGKSRLLWTAKRRLIPLVEYIPGLEQVPWLGLLRVDSGGMSGYVPGHERAVWDVGDIQLAVLICYESLFGWEARSAARQGADAILVLSQNGWWINSRMQLQHRDMTALVARAIGRAVVMAGVSGWTGILSESGRAGPSLSLREPGVLHADVRPRPRKTLYLVMGETFSAMFFVVVVSLGVFQWRKHD